MNVVIILPTYNEKGNVANIITQLQEEIFPKIKNHKMAILVADDNSPDGTAEEVKTLMNKWNNIAIDQGEKKGLGAAYIRGMNYAIEKMDAEILFELDADGQHEAAKIPDFLKKIDEGYDMVIGTRYSGGGSIPANWPFIRKAFSVVANIFVRTVLMRFSIHDWTGGYRALKKEVFLKERSKLESYYGYIFQISFLHKALQDGFKVTEVPFHFSDRTLGDSKIAPAGYIFDVFKYVIIARALEMKRFIKFLFVGGTGFITQLLIQELTILFGLTVFLANLFHGPDATVSDITALSHAIGAGFGAEAAILSNFMFNNFWTFKDTLSMQRRSPFIIRILKFNMTSFGSIFLQFVSIWIAETIFGPTLSLYFLTLPTRIVVLFPTIILLVIPLNYLIYNKIIWKTQYLKHEKVAKT